MKLWNEDCQLCEIFHWFNRKLKKWKWLKEFKNTKFYEWKLETCRNTVNITQSLWNTWANYTNTVNVITAFSLSGIENSCQFIRNLNIGKFWKLNIQHYLWKYKFMGNAGNVWKLNKVFCNKFNKSCEMLALNFINFIIYFKPLSQNYGNLI